MSTPYARLLWLLLVSPIGVCVAHVIVSRLIRCVRSDSIAPQILTLLIILFGNLPMIWISWEFALDQICSGAVESICGIVYVLLTYNALGFWYFSLLNLSETSLHVHVLMELLLDGSVNSDELRKRYSASQMIETRIERMIALGQLSDRRGRYIVTGNAVLVTIGKLIDSWRMVLCLPLRPEQGD